MGGVQFSSFYFIQELQKYPEFETQLLLPRNGQFSKLCEKNSIPFSIYHSHPMWSSSLSLFYDSIRLPNPFAWVYNIIHIYYNSKSIRTILKQHKNAVILSKGLYSHFTTIIANRKLSNKLIWHFQDLISGRFGGFLLKIVNYLAKIGPSYIICDGNSIFKSFDSYNQSKATTILNGVKVDLFQRTNQLRKSGRKEFNIPKNTYVIGHVGRFTPWKGQIKLVEAFIDYAKQNDQAILFLVGAPTFDSDTYLNNIKNIISDHDLNDKIILTGFRSDLNKMFSMMDLFMYPSMEKDTSPLVLISALVSGIPIGVSSIDSLNEITNGISTITEFNVNDKLSIIDIFKKNEKVNFQEKQPTIGELDQINNFDIARHSSEIIKVLNDI